MGFFRSKERLIKTAPIKGTWHTYMYQEGEGTYEEREPSAQEALAELRQSGEWKDLRIVSGPVYDPYGREVSDRVKIVGKKRRRWFR